MSVEFEPVDQEPGLYVIRGGPEVLISPVLPDEELPETVSLEQYLLQKTGLAALDKIPPEDTIIRDEVITIDALAFPFPFDDRRALLAHRLWEHDGKLRLIKKYIGLDNPVRISHLIDRVDDQPELADAQQKIEKFKTLVMHRPRALEVLRLTRAGMQRQDIAKHFRIPSQQIDDIAEAMVLAEIIEPMGNNKRRAMESRAFCDKVKVLADQDMPYAEIKETLHCSKGRLAQAVRKMVLIGEIEKRDPKVASSIIGQRHISLRRRIRSLVSQGYETAQISRISGIPFYRVRYHVRRMQEAGAIPLFVRPRKALIGIMAKLLDEHLRLHPREPVVLNTIRKDRRLNVARSTAQSLYWELAGERAVPPLKKGNGAAEAVMKKLGKALEAELSLGHGKVSLPDVNARYNLHLRYSTLVKYYHLLAAERTVPQIKPGKRSS